MTLPEVLHEAIRSLGTNRVQVVIARGQPTLDEGQEHPHLDGRSQAFQLKLRHDEGPNEGMGVCTYRCKTRSWLGRNWSDWTDRRGWLGGAGFDVEDVLATDWRIVL